MSTQRCYVELKGGATGAGQNECSGAGAVLLAACLQTELTVASMHDQGVITEDSSTRAEPRLRDQVRELIPAQRSKIDLSPLGSWRQQGMTHAGFDA